MDMEKTYQPQSFEQKIYDYWMKNKFFEAHVNKKERAFHDYDAAPQRHGTAAHGTRPR